MTIAAPNRITQGAKESIQSYIDRLIQVVVEVGVGGSEESLKCWIFKNSLKQDNSFK